MWSVAAARSYEQPTCRLGWTALAVIGGIEPGHGTHGGATPLGDATTSIPTRCPALGRSPGFAAIRATPEPVSWHAAVSSDNHSDRYDVDVLGVAIARAAPSRSAVAGGNG